MNGGLEEWLRQDADQAGRSFEQVKLGAQTLGAELTGLPIDGLAFARDRGTVTGQLEIGALPRLAESGCQSATIRYTVRGGENAQRHPCLAVEASGMLRLTCQRCLGALDSPVELDVEWIPSTRQRATASP